MLFPLWPQILSTMTFKSLFGQFTYLFLNLVNFRVSRFHVSHLTHETFKLRLQNTLNMSKIVRVYFGVLPMVLIDPGSAVDLLQLPAFKQMKLSSGMLNLIRRILFGFNGDSTMTLGDVSLPVKVGPIT